MATAQETLGKSHHDVSRVPSPWDQRRSRVKEMQGGAGEGALPVCESAWEERRRRGATAIGRRAMRGRNALDGASDDGEMGIG